MSPATGSLRVVSQGSSRPFLKTFAAVYPHPTDAPGSPRMVISSRHTHRKHLRHLNRDNNYYFCPLFSAGAEHSCLDFREVCNRHDYLLSFVDNQLHGPALCETFGREETAVTETGQGRIMDNKKKQGSKNLVSVAGKLSRDQHHSHISYMIVASSSPW